MKNVFKKMAVSLSELKTLHKSIEDKKRKIQNEELRSDALKKEELKLNDFNFDNFIENVSVYKDIIPENEYIKLDNLDYEKLPYKNFELYIGKNSTGHFVLSFTNENSITKEHSNYHDFYDIKNKKFQPFKTVTQFLYDEMNDVYNHSKELFSKKDYIAILQDELKNILEAIHDRESDILKDLIKITMKEKNLWEQNFQILLKLKKYKLEKQLIHGYMKQKKKLKIYGIKTRNKLSIFCN